MFQTAQRSLLVGSIFLVLFVGVGRAQEPNDGADSSREAEIRAIIEGPQWQQMLQKFDRWLAVQQIYSPEEIAAMKDDFNARILRMQPQEAKQFLADMNARLDVLLSRQAEEAREWVSQFLSVARNPREQLQGKRPDVMNMSAAEIRDELQQFQQQQTSRQQAQAAFNRTRDLQLQSARQFSEATQQDWNRVSESRSRAAVNAQPRSPYAPRPQDLPNYTDFDTAVPGSLSPVYSVGPWGYPIRWNPLRYGYWWW